ncbi:hemerythrin domain-containing protein [Bhargavaea ginsengi]|uniref:hemerythrin domain-containing protein n=1 Tax=Bhargavaea ginsengi TaxID=426757 RepID=UPI00203C1B5E|nr:hemerythrin domain-containing protein [Bhargavaea ginsengi]MCM3087651.1 hemerythrin domain-containing protein [Bhargavaea ginsengi]
MANGQLQFTEPAVRLLENEHRYLMHLAEEWHDIVLRFEREEDMDRATALALLAELKAKLIDFLDPLKNHTDKEEEHFFPVLGGYIGLEQGPIVGIQEEHGEIDAYIGHFFHHTRGDLSGLTEDQIRKIAGDAGEAFEVLTVHFVKEETVLFPMAERLLRADDLDALAEKLNTLIV